MKKLILVLCGVLVSAAVPAFGSTYELIRVTANGQGTAEEEVIRCRIRPGVVLHTLDIGGVTTQQSIPLTTNEDQIQKWVNEVKGITRPDQTNATTYTNWWVRTSPGEEAKFIRSSTTFPEGVKHYEDKGAAAKKLAVLLGSSCFRVFGQ